MNYWSRKPLRTPKSTKAIAINLGYSPKLCDKTHLPTLVDNGFLQATIPTQDIPIGTMAVKKVLEIINHFVIGFEACSTGENPP